MPTVIVRSALARTGTVVVVAAIVLMGGVVWLSDGYGNGLQALSLGLLLAVGVWLLWWRPSLVLTTDCLTVHNAWRTHVVPWPALERTRTRWGLEIVTTDERVIRASAAPRGGGITAGIRQRVATTHGRATEPGTGFHPVTREELVTPGEGTFRTSADCKQGGDLVLLYAAEVDTLRRAARRQERREARLEERRRGRPRQPGGSSHPGPSAGGSETTVDAAATVTSHLNPASVVATGLAGLAVVLTTVLL